MIPSASSHSPLGNIGFKAELELLERLAFALTKGAATHCCDMKIKPLRRASRVSFSENVETWEVSCEDPSPAEHQGRSLTKLQVVARIGRGAAIGSFSLASSAADWCWESAGALAAKPPEVLGFAKRAIAIGSSPLTAPFQWCFDSVGALVGPQVGETAVSSLSYVEKSLLMQVPPVLAVINPAKFCSPALSTYRITYTGTDITQDSAMDSSLVGKLAAGAMVEVLEMQVLLAEDRVRGRICAPTSGWISLWNLSGSMKWALECDSCDIVPVRAHLPSS